MLGRDWFLKIHSFQTNHRFQHRNGKYIFQGDADAELLSAIALLLNQACRGMWKKERGKTPKD